MANDVFLRDVEKLLVQSPSSFLSNPSPPAILKLTKEEPLVLRLTQLIRGGKSISIFNALLMELWVRT